MIGKRIQQLRKEKDLTQEELSLELAVSRSSLSLYETDRREPDGETLLKIADYFDVSLDYLFGRNKHFSNDQNNSTQPQIEEITSLSENELELLEIFRRINNERDQIKLIGRFDEIVEQMTNTKKIKSNDAPSIPSKKNVG